VLSDAHLNSAKRESALVVEPRPLAATESICRKPHNSRCLNSSESESCGLLFRPSRVQGVSGLYARQMADLVERELPSCVVAMILEQGLLRRTRAAIIHLDEAQPCSAGGKTRPALSDVPGSVFCRNKTRAVQDGILNQDGSFCHVERLCWSEPDFFWGNVQFGCGPAKGSRERSRQKNWRSAL
jgi:hypothetical protein